MRRAALCSAIVIFAVACKGEARPPSTAESSAPATAAPSSAPPPVASGSAEPAASPTQASSPPATDGGAGTSVLTFEDSGKRLSLAPGATFTVELRANAGTGFSWQVSQASATVVAPSGPPERTPADPGRPGGPMLEKFTFTAKAPGSAHVELTLQRRFGAAHAVKTFAVDVTVK